MRKFFIILLNGVAKLRENPQLAYTALLALIITGAFVFMADRFIGIAIDAQERLINVRVGSIQDSFVVFASDHIEESGYLNNKINDIIETNETIRSFRVVSASRVIIASNDPSEIGQTDDSGEFLYNLATGDSHSSFTIELEGSGERFFRTIRAIPNTSGNILGMVVTEQTLSLADKIIENNIKKSLVILILVIILIMLLFLRHSKIIDYMKLYQKLKEVDKLKDDFIGMASHELRTPLTIIRGYAEFIKETPELSGKTKEYASKIDTSTKDLDSLVADILDVSRIEQGRMSFKMESIDPALIIEEVVNSLSASAETKGLKFYFSAENRGFISADKDRLKQVLINLIGNSLKYTMKGEVHIRQYAEKNKLLVRVSDTGIGMSAEEQKKLFEKFYRIKTEETKDIRGTGLGLWISAKITKEMGGNLSVESIKSVGSHFILEFPLQNHK